MVTKAHINTLIQMVLLFNTLKYDKVKNLNSLIENGKPRTFNVLYNCNDIIILQPMKQRVSKPGKSGMKQKSLRQIVLEGFARQEERWECQEQFNKQVINRLDRHDQLFQMVLDQFKKHKWIE